MTIQEIVEAVIESKLAGRIVVLAAAAILVWAIRRALEILDRIPPKEWFERMGQILEGYSAHRQTVDGHTGRIAQLEERVEDHEARLSRLQGQHELIHGVGGRVDAKGC